MGMGRQVPVLSMQSDPFSRGARVSIGLWILKDKGPTLNLHILNAEVVLTIVWGGNFLKSVGILWATIDILCYFHKT